MYNGFIVMDNMRNSKHYDGVTTKFGITVQGKNYIVKSASDGTYSVWSEYIASRFIASLNVACQRVWIGYYRNNPVNIILDFTDKNSVLRKYKDIRQSSEGTDLTNKNYTYKDIQYILNKNTHMTQKERSTMLRHFWKMFLCDAILANRDRHHGNWGYIIKPSGVIPAPIYDNGSALFPNFDSRDYNKDKYQYLYPFCGDVPASLLCKTRSGDIIKRTNYYEVLGNPNISKFLSPKKQRSNAPLWGGFSYPSRWLPLILDIIFYSLLRNLPYSGGKIPAGPQCFPFPIILFQI